MIYYIIYETRFNTFFNNIISNEFTPQILEAKLFESEEAAEEELKKLDPGIYEIKKIYYKD